MKSDSKFSMKYDKQTSHQFSVLYQARYCAQEDISIAVCKDGIINMLDHPFSFTNFVSRTPGFSLPKTNSWSKLDVSSSNLYCLFREVKPGYRFVKVSKSSKSLCFLPSLLDERSNFSVCSFMQKILVIGGRRNEEFINSCMAYDCKRNIWNYITKMNQNREDTSSTIFQGKVVVTGGFGNRLLKSVEAYCFHENKWTQFPSMLNPKCNHGSVSLGNKMFVIDRNINDGCEVFDSISNKFTLLKTKPHVKNVECYPFKAKAFTVGYTMHVFNVIYVMGKGRILTSCYDVEKKSWTSENYYNPEFSNYFVCAKMFKS